MHSVYFLWCCLHRDQLTFLSNLALYDRQQVLCVIHNIFLIFVKAKTKQVLHKTFNKSLLHSLSCSKSDNNTTIHRLKMRVTLMKIQHCCSWWWCFFCCLMFLMTDIWISCNGSKNTYDHDDHIITINMQNDIFDNGNMNEDDDDDDMGTHQVWGNWAIPTNQCTKKWPWWPSYVLL